MNIKDILRIAGSRHFLLFGTLWLAFGVMHYLKDEMAWAFIDGLFALTEYSIYYWLKGEENDNR